MMKVKELIMMIKMKMIVLKIVYVGVLMRLVSRRGGSLNWT